VTKEIDRVEFKWTDGNNEAFQQFYIETEKYYSKIVDGRMPCAIAVITKAK
jgi:hypothetical protein